MTKNLVPTEKDYQLHLSKNAAFIRPPELIDWCAKVSPFRTLRIVKTLQMYKPDKKAKLLDLGCGTGLNTVALARAFPNTVAIDVDPRVIKPTKEFLKKFNINIPVLNYDGKKLPFEDNSFDLIACVEVFEHAPNYDQLLKEAARVLKPDGILHITAPNKWWPIEGHYQLPFLSYLPKKLADKYVKLFKKDSGYNNIFLLPTYKQFYTAVSKHFLIEDITFASVINYKKYGIDKERGKLIIPIAGILKLCQKNKLINRFLLNFSLGWLFICRPKN